MPRTPLTAILASTLILAAPAARTTTGAVYERCDEQVAAVPVPAALLQQQLPEGFAPHTPDGEHVGLVAVVGYRCEQQAAPIHEVIQVIAVDPPAELAIDGLHFVMLAGTTSTLEAADRYASWCFDEIMRFGDVTVETVEVPGARIGRATVGGDLLLSATAVSADAAEEPSGMLRVFAVKDGAVRGLVDIAVAAAARASNGAGIIAYPGMPAGPGLGIHVYPGEGDRTNTWIMTGEGFCQA